MIYSQKMVEVSHHKIYTTCLILFSRKKYVSK